MEQAAEAPDAGGRNLHSAALLWQTGKQEFIDSALPPKQAGAGIAQLPERPSTEKRADQRRNTSISVEQSPGAHFPLGGPSGLRIGRLDHDANRNGNLFNANNSRCLRLPLPRGGSQLPCFKVDGQQQRHCSTYRKAVNVSLNCGQYLRPIFSSLPSASFTK